MSHDVRQTLKTPPTQEDRASYGIALILMANLLFSFVDTGSKWLALAGLATMQLAFMRYVGHFVINVGLELFQGRLQRNPFACAKPIETALRGSMIAFATCLNFVAIKHLPLPLTATIMFSTPIIICFLSGTILGERVGPYRWGAIVLGFIGVLVAIRPFDADFHWAVFFSLGAAFMYAFYSIWTRRLAGQVATDTMQLYAAVVGTVMLLPFGVAQWTSPSDSWSWVVLCSLGVFAWAGHQMLTIAHRFAPANLLMPFGYSFMIYLTIWSYFVFDHIPDFWTLVGAVIVIMAGLIIWMRENCKGAKIG